MQRPSRTEDLLASERLFITAMQHLGFGRYESIPIRAGELRLEPWPTTVRSIKFGSAASDPPGTESAEFELKRQVADLFAHVRAVQDGVIQVLEVRGGLPFSMEILADHVVTGV
jgi:hypothetical protein